MQTDATLLANNSQHNLRSGPILAVLIHSLERLPLKLVFVSPYPPEYVTKRNENWAWSQVTPNTVGCYMLGPLAHLVACCCVLLRAVGQSLKPVKPLSQQLPKFLLIRERRRWCNNVGSVCTALPTLVGPRTRIIHDLKVLWVVSFARCTAGPQHCWQLMLRPFAPSSILHEAIRSGQSCPEEIQTEKHF